MILANLAKAIREQNYYAVILEFLIVIAGVVIGFQITAWNSERLDRIEERELLLRLQSEVNQLIEWRSELRSGNEQRTAELNRIAHVLVDQAVSEYEISRLECFAIVRSDLRYRPADVLPTLDEMIAAGRVGLIRNQRIRRELLNFLQYRSYNRTTIDNLASDPFRLPSKYPEFFTLELHTQEARLDPGEEPVEQTTSHYTCDTDAMRSSPAFIMDLEHNRSATQAYALVATRLDNEISDLSAVLEEELSD